NLILTSAWAIPDTQKANGSAAMRSLRFKSMDISDFVIFGRASGFSVSAVSPEKRVPPGL
ncbi:hypothetical protein RA272_30545, partial [Pseudomonas syringae pv. tagetis]|uniref:hypothetical protein n=1 Tax=Pseudomonas syringae group genomosp. 7 TaxID=251699 RepID=UPI00376FEE07